MASLPAAITTFLLNSANDISLADGERPTASKTNSWPDWLRLIRIHYLVRDPVLHEVQVAGKIFRVLKVQVVPSAPWGPSVLLEVLAEHLERRVFHPSYAVDQEVRLDHVVGYLEVPVVLPVDQGNVEVPSAPSVHLVLVAVVLP